MINQEETNSLSKSTLSGCVLAVVIPWVILAILNCIVEKSFYPLSSLIFPIVIVLFAKKYAKENEKLLQYEQAEAKEESFKKFVDNKNLLLVSSLLEKDFIVNDLLKESEIDLLEYLAKVIITNKVKEFEQGLEFELVTMCGSAELKQRLFEEHEIDVCVIDTAIGNIEENLPITVPDLLDEVHSVGCQTKAEKKYYTESRRDRINSFYQTQNQEMNDILSFGYFNVNKLDFEQEIIRTKNLKYYNETLNIPFKIEEFEQRYKSFDNEGFTFYNTKVLNNSIYPSFIKKDFELVYKKEAKTLVVDYCLPNIEDLPSIKQINKQLDEVEFKEKEVNALYENILYQITLRTIFELFYNDEISAIESVVFNGWLDYIDKGDGNQKTSCILSMQAKKDEFMEIKLANVEPKVCFKKFKGISCNNLSTITPVKPILFVNKEDKRFVESYEVMTKLNQGENLAMMDWQDFEHLVREIFEKEFSVNGGEVKITQSSRDGGIDAVAFNPDPIMGGKIVIQAKRYTNVVGISAVRDLYGTILNEGATKGILVTTSHYGADSYDFAKDKPITLLEGNNLLHLMEKHGHKARIDIQEARLLKDS